MKSLFISIILLMISTSFLTAQDTYSTRLIAVDSIVKQIQEKSDQYIVLNTGPVEDIQGSIHIGPVEQDKYFQILELELEKLDSSKTIVVYCGCCPIVVCPNIDPAVLLLERHGFTVRVLNLQEGIDEIGRAHV